MKNFFTSMLGALMALVLFSVGCAVLLGGLLAGMALIGGGAQGRASFERGSYLVFNLSTNISDAPEPVDLSLLERRGSHSQLRVITRALRAAAKDARIAGVFLTGELSPESFGSGFAALREVRAALEEFKASGKPVSAYLTHATTKTYYLASVAGELALDPYGVILMPGLSSEPTFFAGALEKYGVNVQVTRVGKYKSAVEPFTRREMSPENREEVQKLLNDLWGVVLEDIGASRNLAPARIQEIVDREGMLRAEAAKEGGLIDRVAYRDEVYEVLKSRTGRAGSKEPFKQVSLEDYAGHLPEAGAGRGKAGRIAVVYAEGEIVDGEGNPDEVGGSRFSRELRKLRQDENVKAIVLRVNSPGGSASASEVILREVRLAQAVKPVVVSMGSYAASGGYWISTGAARIFAEPTTITGSIGVFGLQFDIQKLAGDFGVTFDSVKTGRFADALTISRPKTPEEMAVLQRMVDWIYGEFVTRVAEGRRLTREQVEAIAQGRVWSGTDALAHGLVDELGGLEKAIAHAAERAGIAGRHRVTEYPRQKELMEAIQEILDRVVPGAARAGGGLADRVAARMEAEWRTLRSFNDPQGVYARLPLTFSLR